MPFEEWGLRCRVEGWGLRFGVRGRGCKVERVGVRGSGSRLEVRVHVCELGGSVFWGIGVLGLNFGVLGLSFWVDSWGLVGQGSSILSDSGFRNFHGQCME